MIIRVTFQNVRKPYGYKFKPEKDRLQHSPNSSPKVNLVVRHTTPTSFFSLNCPILHVGASNYCNVGQFCSQPDLCGCPRHPSHHDRPSPDQHEEQQEIQGYHWLHPQFGATFSCAQQPTFYFESLILQESSDVMCG